MNSPKIRREILALRREGRRLDAMADRLEEALRESSIVRSATVEDAKAFVLATVQERPRQLSTSALRRLARGRRLSNEALSRAIDALQREGQLSFARGARSSRLWYVATAGKDASQCLPGIASTDANDAAEHSDGSETSRPQNGAEAAASGDDRADPHGERNR